MSLSLLVGFHVLGKVVRSHEPLGTGGADESLLAGVRARVTLQLVGAREALPAERPGAGKRPLSRMPAKVGAQVRRLAVEFLAEVADVDAFAALLHLDRSALAVATVRAGAGDSAHALSLEGRRVAVCGGRWFRTVAVMMSVSVVVVMMVVAVSPLATGCVHHRVPTGKAQRGGATLGHGGHRLRDDRHGAGE